MAILFSSLKIFIFIRFFFLVLYLKYINLNLICNTLIFVQFLNDDQGINNL